MDNGQWTMSNERRSAIVNYALSIIHCGYPLPPPSGASGDIRGHGMKLIIDSGQWTMNTAWPNWRAQIGPGRAKFRLFQYIFKLFRDIWAFFSSQTGHETAISG